MQPEEIHSAIRIVRTNLATGRVGDIVSLGAYSKTFIVRQRASNMYWQQPYFDPKNVGLLAATAGS
jgi:hypothetical protein